MPLVCPPFTPPSLSHLFFNLCSYIDYSCTSQSRPHASDPVHYIVSFFLRYRLCAAPSRSPSTQKHVFKCNQLFRRLCLMRAPEDRVLAASGRSTRPLPDPERRTAGSRASPAGRARADAAAGLETGTLPAPSPSARVPLRGLLPPPSAAPRGAAQPHAHTSSPSGSPR